MSNVRGLHHVTAISGAPQANLSFYRNILGLRLVKKTVNFDDPSVYHLYYGDALGRPGSAMTFFPWERLSRGTRGTGEVAKTQFAVPEGSLDAWAVHLRDAEVAIQRGERFGEGVIRLRDPDGLDLVLVEATDDAREGWSAGSLGDKAVRGFHGVTLSLRDPAPTAALLRDLLGYRSVGSEGAVERFEAAAGSAARFVDLETSGEAAAEPGLGSVHHVAFAVPDRDAQATVRRSLVAAGFSVTPPIDRDYFHAIYFRSPGGVLFEVATNEPGFTVDEPADQLGTGLMLPEQHAHLRSRLERELPALH